MHVERVSNWSPVTENEGGDSDGGVPSSAKNVLKYSGNHVVGGRDPDHVGYGDMYPVITLGRFFARR